MALAYVRIISITTTSVRVLFNESLDTDIGIANVAITSEYDNISDPTVRSVSIENAFITVTFDALFPNVKYKITFASTTSQNFQTTNGEVIFEDGSRNAVFITSPGEAENTIRDDMFDDVGTLYATDEQTLVRDLITTTATELEKTSDTLKTVKSGNYLSIQVDDELKTRGDGPIDKLDNGGAFEILRVGSTPTGADSSTSLEFNSNSSSQFQVRSTVLVNPIVESLTEDPISLQTVYVVNEKVSDDVNARNYFDGLRIAVLYKPVAQVIAVSLKRNGVYTEYDIETFGYTLKSNRYDTTSGSTNVNLEDNEIDLSSSSITGLTGGFLVPRSGDEIYISYAYKRLGRDVTSTSVALTRVRDVVRATVPAIATSFTLDYAPIVTSDDEIPTTGGISFLNTQPYNGQQAFSTTHPAFTNEIPYDVTKYPARPGEFSVNYNTGDVVVFGEDLNNQGTGENSPVATYKYRQEFVENLDYTFNSDRDELAVKSTRDLGGIEAKISFDYEDTFASGTDFNTLSHVEVLNERVKNKLVDDFKVQTTYFPITDVFRILNETTGDLYKLDRFNDTTITFTGNTAPKQVDVTRERASFERVPQEVLFVSDELTNSIGLRVFKVELENNGIVDSEGKNIGANFDTSVLLSDPTIFIREFFYEDRLYQSVATNLARLQRVGDYIIDYTNGIIYVAVSASQDTDLGDVSYRHKKVQTSNDHILSVDNVYKSQSVSQSNILTYTVGTITDTNVSVTGLRQAGERFINNTTTRTLLVGSYQSGEDGIITKGSYSFTSYSATFTTDDIGRLLIVGSSAQTPVQEVGITGIINSHEIIVDTAFTASYNGKVWSVVDLSENAAKTITLDNNIISVKDIYTVGQIGTLPSSELDGYFDVNNDTIEDNVITLHSSSFLQVGDAVVVNYNAGNIYIDYKYLYDDIVISYEYGNNSLDWSSSSVLSEGDEYYVTYKYGALRDSLLLNFGSLTQISQLTNFSPNLNREVYRSVVGGALQSFIEGPTVTSIERLVESFTDVTPEIDESAFDNWVLGTDHLHLREPVYNSAIQTFDLGKFDNGAVFTGSNTMQVPALAHVKLNEGTIEGWVRPSWDGVANDATLTFDLAIDGYSDETQIFIGISGTNPADIPFSLSKNDTTISVIGTPSNISTDVGFFIWYDEFEDQWNIRWRDSVDDVTKFSGTITTNGEFYNVYKASGSDGYYINEVTDTITTKLDEIDFTAYIDGYDVPGASNTHSTDGIVFNSDKYHYIFDMAEASAYNRVSVFKDGNGYLNFRVFDNRAKYGLSAGFYNIAKNIRNWISSELHHVAVSWKFNSAYELDEMHLFVDGFEVPNMYKYGGNPTAGDGDVFGGVAEEYAIRSSTRPIIGAFDGATIAGSNVFRSASASFSTDGVEVGHPFYLLDDTADGTGAPNLGAAYYVTGVGQTSLTLDRAPTLTLGNLHYSVGSTSVTVDTPVNIQDFIVTAVDSGGVETELYGVDATYPDYSVSRGNNNTHTITINNRVELGDDVIVRPLGLILRRCKERVYIYDGGFDEIRTSSAEPVNLSDVKITSIVLERELLSDDGYSLSSAIIDSQLVTVLQTSYTNMCQPSNTAAGKKLKISLSGDNFNYGITGGNTVTINGTTYSGAVTETVTFTESESLVTSQYWKYIDSISVSVVPLDISEAAGAIEIKENIPITLSENNGDYAEVAEYSNGVFRLEIYGSGGMPYILGGCRYEIDYPAYLRIRIDAVPDSFYIGSDYAGNYNFEGIIDEFRILDYMSVDTRPGEELTSTITRSITTDYNSSQAFTSNANTLLLLHFDDTVEDKSVFRDRFDSGFEVADSVNSNFGTALKISENRPFIISNDASVFNPNEGTIEFWLSPLDDSREDPNFHYYIDMSAVVEETVTSITALNVVATRKIREVESVRLTTDIYNTGTNYYTGGSVSNVDGKTITLGIPLPKQTISVKITYVPLSNQGDRVSIFRDEFGRVNFFVKASGVEHLISVPISWDQNTWHRIMAMWKMNSTDNQDRLRLFVDGTERGTIKYGTGLIYGTGILYGQAEIRSGVNRFLVDNIDMTDTFSRIFVGTDVYGVNGARSLIDNLRFSKIQRLQSIKTVLGENTDLSYTSNSTLALPVVTDLNTTALYNFDKVSINIENLTTLIDAERGIFRFNVTVIDSFNKITNSTSLKALLEELIDVIKPAHTEAIVEYADEE